jgi:tRNA-dihydrouridine synthase A
MEAQRDAGVPLIAMTRHILGLFNGVPGARAWRRYLSQNTTGADAGVDIVREALALVQEQAQANAA